MELIIFSRAIESRASKLTKDISVALYIYEMMEKLCPGPPQLPTSYSAHLNITVVISDIRPIIQLDTAKAAAPELGPTSP